MKTTIKTSPLFLFFSWRILTILLTLLLINFNLTDQNKTFLQLWANWDGGHYVGIAENGYVYLYQFAFFPLYPMLIKTSSFLLRDNYLSALLISNLAFLGCLVVLEKLAKVFQLQNSIIRKSTIMLLTFPTAFFLAAAYTESLLLFFILTSIYFAKKKNWFLASIFAGFATFTKSIGIVVTIVLLAEYLLQINPTKFDLKLIGKKLLPLFYILSFGLSGLYLYGYYLYYLTGNFFYFAEVQSHWGRIITINNPLTIILTAINNFFPLRIQSFEIITILLTISILPFINKKFGLILSFYTLFLSIFTLFSGTTESSLRYVILAFPIFWLFGSWAEKSKLFFITYLTFGITTQIILLSLFLMNKWVG